jgi:hypothetical protein
VVSGDSDVHAGLRVVSDEEDNLTVEGAENVENVENAEKKLSLHRVASALSAVNSLLCLSADG